ncbi:hypothetical protein HWV00_04410 [Moritella sp. 24]|uniref:hypothetical protein n=1 Tax=Moritella sp. 24 TaxID=2746230 RepID=UPI001BAC54E0|nr:hypothetical protein [Moritella sp. 24]QUM75537.1 hypothetical protein HWV00_04410 [Moritella sp. 24]
MTVLNETKTVGFVSFLNKYSQPFFRLSGRYRFSMTSHRDLNNKHETSVLASYKNHLKTEDKILEVINRPDPPDAFVTIDGKNTWVEITDAHFSRETAISITSYAADDKTHIPSKEGLIGDPDSITTERVESAIRAKLNKNSMIELAASNEPGILLVGLYGPFFDIKDVENNLSDSFKIELEIQDVFRSIYVYQTCRKNVHIYKKIR